MPAVSACDTVEIPDTVNPLTPQQMDELLQAVDLLEQCDDLGISLYIAARAFVSECI